MRESFSEKEALLGLATVITWADGENQRSEIDVLVQLMVEEKITDKEFESFKLKYDEIDDFETVFLMSISVMQNKKLDDRSRALAWMWQVANVADENSEGRLNYIEDVWKNNTKNVDLDELRWINRAKRLLNVDLEDFKSAFNKLSETQRIL